MHKLENKLLNSIRFSHIHTDATYEHNNIWRITQTYSEI